MADNTKSSSVSNKKPIIALDGDCVLLDFHSTFAQTYEKAFGKRLSVVTPNSWRPTTKFDVKFTPEERTHFDKIWEADAWRTMPVIDGSVQACNLLHEAGYELVCVTAMPSQFIEHRLENLRMHGFPINRVISTGYDRENPKNLKKQTIEELHPVAFVDDIRKNFKDIQGVDTKFIFIDYAYHDEPTPHDDIYYDAKYPSLLAFVNDFLQTEHGQEIVWPERPAYLLSSK